MNKLAENNESNSSGITYREALEILTPREIEVLQGVAAGRTSREIGEKLNLSYRTIQKCRENICKKLQFRGYRSLFKWCLMHINGQQQDKKG